jgi:hypothetical protein
MRENPRERLQAHPLIFRLRATGGVGTLLATLASGRHLEELAFRRPRELRT